MIATPRPSPETASDSVSDMSYAMQFLGRTPPSSPAPGPGPETGARRAPLRFELRHKSVPSHKRDLVHFVTKKHPQLQARLDRMEIELIGAVGEKDPLLYEFLEWYHEESRLFGLRVRPGLAALYWLWADEELPEAGGAQCTHPNFEVIAKNPYAEQCGRFSGERYEELRDGLATRIAHEYLDGNKPANLYTGKLLMQEFIWWSSGEWLYLGYLVAAICEFREFRGAGLMADWRRRRRRRLAASQRRAIKEALSSPAGELS